MSWTSVLPAGLVSALMLTACAAPPPPAAKAPPPKPARVNPLLQKSTLPFQVPQFDKIKESDFIPAFEKGMAERAAEIKAIAENPAAPTFENTIVAMEKSGQLLTRVERAFSPLAGTNSDDTLRKIEATEAPKLSASSDAIYLNARLFARVKAIYHQRNALHLTPDAVRLVELTYQSFVLAGANVPEAQKPALQKINGRLSVLTTKFTSNVLHATQKNALVVDNVAALKGLSDAEIAQAADAAKARGLTGKWVLPLQNTTQQPALAELQDRDTRKKLFELSWNRNNLGDAYDNRAVIRELAELRAQKAKILGFKNYAALALADQMAKTPENATGILKKLTPATVRKARQEASDIQKMIYKTGGHFKLQPWDWEYYSDKVRKAKFNLNEDQLKPYFELHKVLVDGLFFAANKLYGLTFKERHDLPTWNPDMMVYEVFDKDGKSMGLAYFDYFKRDSKAGGAWMDVLVEQSKLLGTKPVIYNVCNFQKPAAGQPALISADDVVTMFHEFGHGLHGLLSNQTYPSIAGTNVPRDFVEFPSQFNEHWATYPEVFNNYAKNYKTGKPMPAALFKKMQESATFNQGYMTAELVAAMQLDLQWHMISPETKIGDVDAFEHNALVKTHLALSQIPPRYRSTFFQHIWSGGYSAGYYAYMWAEMIDDDAFDWFLKHGGLTRENGQRFRDMVLSRGNSENLAKMYKDFAGRDPSIKPLERKHGLIK